MVDDDINIVMLFEKILVFEGHEVIGKAYNGEEALNKFKNLHDNPDIVIMDHRMPIKDGVETTKEMLNLKSNTKIIFASADYKVKDIAKEVGAVDFLEKPFDFSTLFDMIEKHTLIKNRITQ
ncbi:MAG: response regulator [Candidatus Thorarchaeota archaeon]